MPEVQGLHVSFNGNDPTPRFTRINSIKEAASRGHHVDAKDVLWLANQVAELEADRLALWQRISKIIKRIDDVAANIKQEAGKA